jgi:flagellin FlaB
MYWRYIHMVNWKIWKYKKFNKDDQAFTGLEAAIVLTAFVVVAAVFSYVVLGAGFFTAEKSKEVVHTGMNQATSSVELAGEVIGHGSDPYLTNATVYLQLTAGDNAIDMSKLTIAYTDKYVYNGSLTNKGDAALSGAGQWNYSFVADQAGEDGNDDVMLDANEKGKIHISLPADAGDYHGGVPVNNWFQIEIKAATGASLPIKKTVPGTIDTIMVLT